MKRIFPYEICPDSVLVLAREKMPRQTNPIESPCCEKIERKNNPPHHCE
jgi:hypothetical protein